MEKIQRGQDEFVRWNGTLRRTYLLARAGWSSRFSPPSATSPR